jgi:hypothetical protein
MGEHGDYRYRCHGCGRNLSLARLFAAVTSGDVDESDAMAAPTAARWLARAWHEAGVKYVPMPAIILPEGCSPAARRLAAGFILLAGLRAVEENGADPVPYSYRFAAEWCALSVAGVRRGIAELLRLGWLVPVGYATGAGRLYRVGAAWQPSVGQEVDRDHRHSASRLEGVAEEIGLPDRSGTLEPTRIVVGVQPRDECSEVAAVQAAEVSAVDGAASASGGAAGRDGVVGGHARSVERARVRGSDGLLADAELERLHRKGLA